MPRSDMKRAQPSSPASPASSKKPRRSQRIAHGRDPLSEPEADDTPPSPAQEKRVPQPEPTASPRTPAAPSKVDMTPASSPGPRETQESTQVASQFYYPPPPDGDVDGEEDENVWGYLTPLDTTSNDKYHKTIKLNKTSHCQGGKSPRGGSTCKDKKGTPTGFLIGRHLECDLIHSDSQVISNRHCVIYKEVSAAGPKAVLEDLSSNGTWVNGTIVGRNHRRELKTGDEIELAGGIQYMFRYPAFMQASKFRDAYDLGRALGSGHFATVHLAVEKKSGQQYAVKIFKKRRVDDKASTAGLQQEIAVLMSVAHPSVLCLKDTYDEEDGVYLILELAPEGELFNYIIKKQKLSEEETRHIFKQLLGGLKYLHDRNIVHRDIKPENILLCDKELTVKLADFGLAKIIGEDSFTTSLCGTPSYVAPEILQNSHTRQYSHAVDMWSMGVVLYICLCGFPPFSDELCTPENPYNLSEQIKMARFDFPSPYWDSVGDPALDLIERMLEVNPKRRITVDDALRHPWLTALPFNPGDSCDSLAGGFENLGFVRKKVAHERTLLADAPEFSRQPGDVEPGAIPSRRPHTPPARPGGGNGVGGSDKKPGTAEKKKSATPNANSNGTVIHPEPSNPEPTTKAFMNVGGKGAAETLYPAEEDDDEEEYGDGDGDADVYLDAEDLRDDLEVDPAAPVEGE